MKREIKFRMWNPYRNGFHHDSDTVLECLKQQVSKLFHHDHLADGSCFEQFTGLKDQNGGEIYEGDIIEVTNKGAYNGLRVVSWDETLLCYVLIWTPHYKKFLTSGKIPGSYLKVSSGLSCYLIGNIHQHPHLLTGDRADTGEK